MRPLENHIFNLGRTANTIWDEDDYGFYGLPLFKATAVKYGWDNPIGEDSGRERKYDSQY